MKKLELMVLCLLCLCGCEFKKNNDLSEESVADKDKIKSEEKGYTLTEYDVPCGLKNVSYISGSGALILSDNKFYVYSDKKYSETDSNCKILDDEKTYKYIGEGYFEYEVVLRNSQSLFLASDGNYYIPHFTYNGVENYHYYDDDKSLNGYKKGFYYYDNSYYLQNGKYYYYHLSIIDNTISLSCFEHQDIDDKCNDVYFALSENEEIFFVVNSYIITNKNVYIIDKSDNDKCDEYVDVPCTYVLKKLDENNNYQGYVNLYNDYEDNILFLSNRYLITKDNKVYKVELK